MNYNTRYLLITFLLYMQNLLFSLLCTFVFIPSLLEFALILGVVFIISNLRYSKSLFIGWIVLYFIHFSFMSYFGDRVNPSDIYLFFTHLDESYESFIYTLYMYTFPLMITLFTLVGVLFLYQKSRVSLLKLLSSLFIAVVLFNYVKVNDASFLLVKAVYKSMIPNSLNVEKTRTSKKLHRPLKKPDINVVLVIGESMRAKEFHKDKYEMFENNFYKTIYSGATSTDVSIPLLLNGALKPSAIDVRDNLFSLAKKNGYKTHFVTTQSTKNMRYIEPYMMKKSIDKYQVINSKLDEDLLKELRAVDINDSEMDFIVLQMQGQHSPYIYYPEYKKSTIKKQYAESMEYSNSIILQMIEYIKSSKRETLFIFTSDHGELIGENSRVGHNRFEEQIYRVPLIIFSTCRAQIEYENIVSHHSVYQLIYHTLGYSKEYNMRETEVRINGSMLSEEDGFKIVDIIAP